MPPINPPNPLNQVTIDIDNTDLINSILLNIEVGLKISYLATTDPNWVSGVVSFEYLDLNDVWQTLANILNTSSDQYHAVSLNIPSNTDAKYPFKVRIIVNTAETTGTGQIKVNYI